MSQHLNKFDSMMIKYCSDQAEKAYKLFEDKEVDYGLECLAHLADVLLILKESRSDSGIANINSFVNQCSDLTDIWKEQIWVSFQENGFGQYIPE